MTRLVTIMVALQVLAGAAWAGGSKPGRKADRLILKCVKEGEGFRCETPDAVREKEPTPSKSELEEAYRRGFDHAIKKMKQMWMEYSEAEHYVWKRPVMQKIWMPPEVVNGVLIPGHEEYVLLKPGEWKLRAPEGSPRPFEER